MGFSADSVGLLAVLPLVRSSPWGHTGLWLWPGYRPSARRVCRDRTQAVSRSRGARLRGHTRYIVFKRREKQIGGQSRFHNVPKHFWHKILKTSVKKLETKQKFLPRRSGRLRLATPERKRHAAQRGARKGTGGQTRLRGAFTTLNGQSTKLFF